PRFSQDPVTIWSQLSDSHCITFAARRLQTPSSSTVYARSPVKSGFQRALRKSRTIVPIAVQNFSSLLPLSFYWSFYWRSLWFTSRPPLQPGDFFEREQMPLHAADLPQPRRTHS